MTTLLRSGLRRVAARLTPDDTSDGRLLARHLAGDDDSAFAVLVRRHAGLVYGTCRRVLGPGADADDAFQVTFIVLLRRAASFVDRACVGNFLYGVAYHTALKAKAMAAKRRLREAKVTPERSPLPDPELLAALDEELAKLPEKYREAIVLCELDGLARAAVAARLGIPVGTISSRLTTAHRMLEKRLKARGFAEVILTSILAEQSATATSALVDATVQTAMLGPTAGLAPLVTEVMKMFFLNKLKLHGMVLAGISCLVLSGGMIAVPGDGRVQGEDQPLPRTDAPTAESLVKQLGDPAFKTREAAEKPLRAMGKKAIPALRVGLKSESPEVVERSEKVLRLIHKDALDRFVADGDALDSPVWKRFQAIAGDGKESRALYVEMMPDATSAELLESVEGNAAKSFEAYRTEMERVDGAWTAAFKQFIGSFDILAIRNRSLEVVKRDAILRCLFLGAQLVPEKGIDPQQITMLFHGHFVELTKSSEKEPFRKLYLAWLKHRKNPVAVQRGLEAALFMNIPEAAPFARELITNAKHPPELLAHAILVLGNHGELADVLLLDKLRTDERVYCQFNTMTIELREVATAMALLLRKEDVAKYGFDAADLKAWCVGDKSAFRAIGWFQNKEDRDAALTKAWKWLDAQPKPLK